MLHRRHTITIATSALIFLCIALHAQSSATSLKGVSYNDAEAYKIYESLLPTDWTVTVAHAQRLLIQAQTGSMGFCLKPEWLLQPTLHLDLPYELVSRDDLRSFFKPGGGSSFHVLEKKDGVWKNLHWKGTSRAWAS